MQVLIVQHSPHTGVGEVGRYLENRRGASLRTIGPEAVGAPGVEDGADLVIILGSARGVYEPLPWIAAEVALARRCMAQDRPLLGLCFGAQIIAKALGGEVRPSGDRFFGWDPVEAAASPAIAGPWFRWHGDVCTLPADVEILGRTRGIVQAFQKGRALGFQFHPEVDPPTIAAWASEDRSELVARGYDPGPQVAAWQATCATAAPRIDALMTEALARLGLASRVTSPAEA